MVRKICERKIGNITYVLKHFEGDNKYVIYRWDKEKMKNGQIHRIPEEAIFNKEKDAKEYLEKLK